ALRHRGRHLARHGRGGSRRRRRSRRRRESVRFARAGAAQRRVGASCRGAPRWRRAKHASCRRENSVARRRCTETGSRSRSGRALHVAQRLRGVVRHWQDGRETTIRDVRPNRIYEISQSGAASRGAQAAADTAKPLFEDATSQLQGHIHHEDTFDDWDRQFLLPNALSQLGPGVSWFDVDRDGSEDLLVGTGKGGQLGIFKNSKGRLSPQPKQGPVAPADFTTVLGLSEGSSVSLLTGVSTWQARTRP